MRAATIKAEQLITGDRLVTVDTRDGLDATPWVMQVTTARGLGGESPLVVVTLRTAGGSRDETWFSPMGQLVTIALPDATDATLADG